MKELIERAARDLINSNYAIALTGAGMSTESGIPDFRGPDGIWTKNPEAEREAYQAYNELLRDPKAHWEKRLNPSGYYTLFLEEMGKAESNPGHYALADLEKMGILKLTITQNVDGLHQKAGSQNVIEYHGGLWKLRCMSCGSRFPEEEYDLEKLIREDQLPPRCRECGGVLKSDGVYFMEPIPSDVAHQSLEAAWKCDSMLICGTSAVVYPFAQLPRVAREKKVESERRTDWGMSVVERKAAVNIIEINAEPTPLTHEGISDYLIQGKTGEVLPLIVNAVRQMRGG